jgi:preprotein translocase subunit SecY
MAELLRKFKIILTDSGLRSRLLFVLGALVVFRLLANIPIPAAASADMNALLGQSQFLGFLNILTGGGLSAISIVMLGVGPYITASIIMQLLTVMSPKLKALYHEEGELGRRKFVQYSRMLTIPLAIMQGWGLFYYLQTRGIFPADMIAFDVFLNVVVVVAGSILLMWIGELISEFGIGNGVSLIIFAGIVSRLPSILGQLQFTFTAQDIPLYLGMAAAAFVIITAIVTMTEAERPVPVTYAKRVRGMKVYGGTSTYLPLRLNQAGVMPIIFALSFLVFPQALVNILAQTTSGAIGAVAGWIGAVLSNQVLFSGLYFALVFIFTFFYTAVTFDPQAISTNLQKNGAFIPGVRPGPSTADYLGKVLTRITLVGAVFLGIVAILPFAMIAITGNQNFALGGTALLIVVAVILDLVKKVDAQVAMREY